jgi:formylglycine-generating enzyme required for sulfatase activity
VNYSPKNSSYISSDGIIGTLNEKMIYVNGGESFIGTDNPAIPGDYEGPRRTVYVSPFFLDKYEVSNHGIK